MTTKAPSRPIDFRVPQLEEVELQLTVTRLPTSQPSHPGLGGWGVPELLLPP